MTGDDLIHDLTEALAISPDNPVLRQRLGEMMLRRGMLEEADTLYREGLALTPKSDALLLGRARCAMLLGRTSEAMVIVEDLVARPGAAGAAHLLHARLLLRGGELDRAAHAYRRAIDLDDALADDELAAVLGLDAGASSDDDDAPYDAETDDAGRLLHRAFQSADDDVTPTTDLERPDITFADVGGLDALKEEIRLKIIHPIAHPELYEAYGRAAGGGVLLYGPPGCGKTYLARATAGEIDANFIAVGINDILDMYIGQSEAKLHALFEQARRAAPCVLFFDEVDALGASRSDMRHSAGRHLINQFLSELDGVQHSNDGVLILGATNAPWHLDPAFRRPGRFDRVIFVPPPDRAGRAEVLRVQLRGKPVADIDHDAIARKTAEFSGADLKSVVDHAIEGKLAEAMRTGTPAPITTKDLTAAAKVRRSTTSEWFATARNYALYANESGAYDDIAQYLESRKKGR